ncbi:MAG: Beta-alanine--pyruvate aminotransferase [Chroococcidiopsis cubana SAG 39.79]|jgi:beta-alanine--pyruvate transaminase|uniref:Aspartate aminotransferase family protein n=1 Tax=Chroococcidiopsis cubana SAG 39.79 TaxID=388085 RepID=A0AB37UIQ1_9CYAN|nr:aspartate aminotransferase family protein [Chroococcidiopsis cubana]MDZ4872329.1 Beta-alanine--pyruvate aminotransferase [Chroococcidiopsis cubana SAG 39.79]PSB62162.1 aspartate aminotransferase family protein [Chroococcidiopsis cubana CCALA 043]RUT11261.1 aspartate aminotransferase family protein [Chroococcidiopsis cubana SAG 39.79]
MELATTTNLPSSDLDAFWMPFTANRQFKASPRLLVAAEGMYYTTSDGRQIIDGTAGLWCVNAGHGRREIADAVQKQVMQLDFAPTFQMGHPAPFELATRLVELLPGDLNRVFFTNSGSESVDTALKIAIAYHRLKGQGARQRLIGRERGYHGVNFGGTAVGGTGANRKLFGNIVTGIDHLSHTHNLEHNAFTRGQPKWGEHLANELERLVTLHDASTIAAVIVEPVAGSTGVLLPPVGYLQKLRQICDKHGILLIFDEVITGFGRLGKPFAADYFGVIPDIITVAKGITNATVPMGAVFVREEIYQTFVQGIENGIEFFHGYTYSGHPVACAASLATLDIYKKEGLLTRVSEIADYWENAVHSLRGLPHVIDLRNLGLVGAIELESIPGKPGARGYETFVKCYQQGALVRAAGDNIALSPPLIIEKQHIDELFGVVTDVLKQLA